MDQRRLIVEPQPNECKPGSHEGQSSFLSGGCNIANAALGAGVLLFPQLMAQNGLLVGMCSMVIGCLIMGGTLHILALAAFELGEVTYQDALSRSVGRFAAKGVDITMSLYLFGTCASYLVLIADQAQAVFSPHLDGSSIRILILLCVVLLETPLMLLSDISRLAATSAFGVFTNLFCAFVIMSESLVIVLRDGMHPGIVMATGNWYRLASAFATYAFSFQCHLIFIPVYWTMWRRSVRKMDGVILFAYTLCFIAYGGCGILGYAAFGPEVESDILALNLPSNWVTNLARACLAVKTFVSYPLLHFPARLCLGDLLLDRHVTDPDLRRPFYALTLFFMVLTFSVAACVPDIGFLINLTSALLGVFQVFVWPGLMFYYMRNRSIESCLICCFLVALGLMVTVVGTYSVFQPSS